MPGNDIQVVVGKTFQECISLCKAIDTCMGLTWALYNGYTDPYCYPKSMTSELASDVTSQWDHRVTIPDISCLGK